MSNSTTDGSIWPGVLLFLVQFNTYSLTMIAPASCLVGFCANLLIIVTMLKQEVKIRSTARMFYIVIAIGYIGSLVFWNVREFLTIGLWLLTGGRFYLPLYSPLICKVFFALFHLFVLIAIYTIISMSIDLLFLLYFPFKHQVFMTLKRSFYIILAFVGPICLIQVPLTFLTVTSYSVASFPVPLCGGLPNHPLYTVYTISAIFFTLFLHPPLFGIIEIFIIVKTISISLQRKKLHREGKGNVLKGAERTIFVLAVMAILDVFITIPAIGIWSGVMILRANYPASIAYKIFEALTRFSTTSITIGRSINIIVYVLIIPSFRRALPCACKWGNDTHNGTSRNAKGCRNKILEDD